VLAHARWRPTHRRRLYHGKPDLGIHRVVDGGSTIATPAHLDVHQVGRVLAQGVARQPFLTDCVGEHDGCSGRTGPHQVTYDNAAFGTAQVELEGLLALVEAGLVKARPRCA
jgi:hypothetical protein